VRGAGVDQVKEQAAGCSWVVAAHQDLHGPRDLRRIAADDSAIPVEDAAGMPELRSRAPGAAPYVGVPGDDPQRCLLAGAADEDRRMGALDRPGPSYAGY
jgi:hypothetical protein